MGFQGQNHAFCTEPPHLLVAVTICQPLLACYHHDGAIPTMSVSEISRSPVWQGLQQPWEVEEEFYNSSKTVQGAGAEEGNTSKEKQHSGLVPGPQLRKETVSQTVYLYGQAYTDVFCLHSRLVRYEPAPVQTTQTL